MNNNDAMSIDKINQTSQSFDNENKSGNSVPIGMFQTHEIDCGKHSLSNLPMLTSVRQFDSASSLGTSTTACSNPSQSTRADSDNQNFQDYSCNTSNTRNNSANDSTSSVIIDWLQNDDLMKELDRLALSMALNQRSDLDGSLDLDCAVDMSRISRISSQKFLQEFVINTLRSTTTAASQTSDDRSVISETPSCQSLPMPKRSRITCDLRNTSTTRSSFKINQKPASNNRQSRSNPIKRVHTMPSLNAPQTIIGPASASVKTKNQLLEKEAMSPDTFFRSMIISQGIKFPTSKKIHSLSMKDYFLEPTPELIAAYDTDVTTAARNEDLEALKVLHSRGHPLQCCNRFGESILHVACRRGSATITRFLLDEANVSLRVRDDFGRTPLHDACWTREPAFELVKMLIEKEPDLLLVCDKRGNTPLEYVRRDHWKVWCQFLTEMEIEKITPSEEMIIRLKE